MARVRDNVRDKGNKSCIWKAANSECSWNLRICEGKIGRNFLSVHQSVMLGFNPESKAKRHIKIDITSVMRCGTAARCGVALRFLLHSITKRRFRNKHGATQPHFTTIFNCIDLLRTKMSFKVLIK